MPPSSVRLPPISPIFYQTNSKSSPSHIDIDINIHLGLYLLWAAGFLPRTRDAALDPRLGHTLYDNAPAEPTHVHVHEHDIANGPSGECSVFARRRAIFVRDGR